MKRPLHPVRLTVCALGATALVARAQFDPEDPSFLKNRVKVGGMFMLNVSATIRGVPVAPQAGPQYDDGFVARDISGNAGGKTWNWGYQNQNQAPGDGNLYMHSLDGSPRDGRSITSKDDYAPAFSLTYGRELRRWAVGEERYLIVGVEGGFASMDANISTGDTVSGTVARTTYAYSLGGIVPPAAPYNGTFAGPGPLIDSNPSQTTSEPVPVTSALNARVRSLLYGFRFGPFVDIPLARRWSVQLSGGVAAMYSDAELKFTDTVTIDQVYTGGAPASRDTSYHHGDWSIGYYGQVAFSFELNPSLRLYVGGEYQSLGDHTISGPGLEATLKASNMYGGVIGLQLLF